MEKNCIFCKIISREIPAEIIFQDELTIVIKDIHPKAPTHYLIIPKKHVVSLHDAVPSDNNSVLALMVTAQKISQHNNNQDFRLISNNGALAGQSVFHLHFHYLAGKQMVDF